MIKVLLFDFYGVFLPDAYSAWLEENGLTREGVFADLINRRDKNEITESDFMSQLSDALGREVLIDEIHNDRHLPDASLIALIEEIVPFYQVCLFSNASTKLRTKLSGLKLDQFFDTVIISSEIGYAKPSKEAFMIAIDMVAAKTDEILFIDDNKVNVEAARQNGLVAILYTSASDLRDRLQAYKII